MNELHRLFIARETLAALGPSVLKLAEKEKASAPAEEEEVEEQSTVASTHPHQTRHIQIY